MKLLVRSGILGRHSMRKHDGIMGTEKKVAHEVAHEVGILQKYSMRRHNHKYSTASRSTISEGTNKHYASLINLCLPCARIDPVTLLEFSTKSHKKLAPATRDQLQL